MRASDLGRFLLFDEAAMRRLAADGASLPVGAALVLMATIAREYDERDLLHEPHLFGIGLGLSIGVAAVLYALIRILYRRRWVSDEGEHRPPEFRVLLAIVWLTAPLAWIYAIPVERFADSLTAAYANVGALMIVAAWRVLLVTRAVGVLTGAGAASAAQVVMAPSAAIFCGALALMPGEVLQLMGGARLDAGEQFIASVKTYGPFVFGLAAMKLGMDMPRILLTQRGVPDRVQSFRVSSQDGVPVAFMLCCVVAWGAVVATYQPLVRRAHAMNRALASGDAGAAKKAVLAMRLPDWPPRIVVHPDPRDYGVMAELVRLLNAGVIDALPPDHWYRRHALDLMGAPYFVTGHTWEHAPAPARGKAAEAFAEAVTNSPAARAWMLEHPLLDVRFGHDPDDKAKKMLAWFFEGEEARRATHYLQRLAVIEAALCAWSRARFGPAGASTAAQEAELAAAVKVMNRELQDAFYQRGWKDKGVNAWGHWFAGVSRFSDDIRLPAPPGPFAALAPRSGAKGLERSSTLAGGDEELAKLGVRLPRESALRTCAWLLESGHVMNSAAPSDALEIMSERLRTGPSGARTSGRRDAECADRIRTLRTLLADRPPLDSPGVRDVMTAYESALTAVERFCTGETQPATLEALERARAAMMAAVEAAAAKQRAVLADLKPCR